MRDLCVGSAYHEIGLSMLWVTQKRERFQPPDFAIEVYLPECSAELQPTEIPTAFVSTGEKTVMIQRNAEALQETMNNCVQSVVTVL